MLRRNLIVSKNTPVLVKKAFKSSEFDKWLFGDGLIEKIKSAKVSEGTLKPIGEKESGAFGKQSQAPKDNKGPHRAGKDYCYPQNNHRKSYSGKPRNSVGKNKRRSDNSTPFHERLLASNIWMAQLLYCQLGLTNV